LLSTISAKDKYTHGHCERVAAYAVLIAEAMGLSAKEISTIQCAALLHDIGKIEMPKHILNKKEELTEEEIKYLRQHLYIVKTYLSLWRTWTSLPIM